MDRESLIGLCGRAVVPYEHWCDRDSAAAQRQVGECAALLKAGCEFQVDVKGRTIWLTVTFPGFGHFDCGGEDDSELFYLPTEARLSASMGRDWY